MKRQPTKAASISSSRWAAYAVAGLATAPSLVSSAEGEIHYSGRIDFQLPAGQVTLPLSGGESLLFEKGLGGADALMWITPALSEGVATDTRHPYLRAEKLHRGVNVSTEARFASFGYLIGFHDSGEFRSRGQGLAAFEFNTGRGEQYGWARIRTSMDGVCTVLEIIDYAWADPGEPILTGQTKEGAAPEADAAASELSSGSLGLLALGSAGLAASRKARGLAR